MHICNSGVVRIQIWRQTCCKTFAWHLKVLRCGVLASLRTSLTPRKAQGMSRCLLVCDTVNVCFSGSIGPYHVNLAWNIPPSRFATNCVSSGRRAVQVNLRVLPLRLQSLERKFVDLGQEAFLQTIRVLFCDFTRNIDVPKCVYCFFEMQPFIVIDSDKSIKHNTRLRKRYVW